MKTVRYCLVALVLLLVVLFNWHSLDSVNQDIGRHLKLGEIIWQTKSVPATNLFSYTEPDHPFINHHWLSEVIFYLTSRWVGLKGLIGLKVLVITAAFVLANAALGKKLKTPLWPLATLLGLLVFSSRSDVRPEIFSYLFFSFFLFAIWRAKYALNFKYLNWLPVVELLWVNSHIYFFLGPLLLLYFLLDQVWQFKNWRWFSISNLTLRIFILTSIATLFNPNFLQGALSPFTILQHYGYSIVENQSLWFLTNYGILLKSINLFEFSLVLLTISFVIALAKRQPVVFELLLVTTLSLLAMKMLRNVGLYGLAFGPLMGLQLATLTTPGWLGSKLGRWLVPAVVGSSLIWLLVSIPNNRLYRWLDSSKTFGLTVPRGAAGGVDFVRKNMIVGPMFNNFDVGSYLLWQLYPEQKVFVDGRPEAYSVEFFEKIYKPMQTNPAVWEKYSKQYGINYIFFDWHDLTPWAQTFLARISHDPHWPLVYQDETVVIFVKK